MRVLTFFGFRQLLFAVTMFPAVEKNLLKGTDVAVTQSSFLATIATMGKRSEFLFHQSKGFALSPGDDERR